MKKTGMPKNGELVVCRIADINPNSAFAQLVEYGIQGMMHVSEVASRWVRDIREFLKVGQFVVCRVISVEGEHVYLSMKKVKDDDKVRKLNEFKRENKSEKILEIAAKNISKNLDQMYEEVGYKLQDEFGSLTKSLEIAAKNPRLLKEKGIQPEWVMEISKVADGMRAEKTHEVIADINVTSYSPDGVNSIKKALKIAKSSGFEVRYVSAPHYQMIGKGKNEREITEKMEMVARQICNCIKPDGEADFEIKK